MILINQILSFFKRSTIMYDDFLSNTLTIKLLNYVKSYIILNVLSLLSNAAKTYTK